MNNYPPLEEHGAQIDIYRIFYREYIESHKIELRDKLIPLTSVPFGIRLGRISSHIHRAVCAEIENNEPNPQPL